MTIAPVRSLPATARLAPDLLARVAHCASRARAAGAPPTYAAELDCAVVLLECGGVDELTRHLATSLPCSPGAQDARALLLAMLADAGVRVTFTG